MEQLTTIESLQKTIEELKVKLKTMEHKLTMSHSAFLNIVGKSLDGIVILDKNKMVVYTNYAAIQLFDRNIADLLGEPLELAINIAETVSEINIPHADGSISIAEASILRTEWNNQPSFLVSLRDITERKKRESTLDYLSHHDYLTGLPNRAFFEQKMAELLSDAQKQKKHVGLLYIDLDNFKLINDTLGHDMGDHYLKKVTDVLQNNVREGDLVARLGGDEFAVCVQLKAAKDAKGIANHLLKKLIAPIRLQDKDIIPSASIGIAVFPESGNTIDDLLKNADTAMYLAKQNGKNRVIDFTNVPLFLNNVPVNDTSSMNIIHDLNPLSVKEEFFLEYQPIYKLKDLSCFAVEALIRWQHPRLGLLPPNDFLPQAEELGVMHIIDAWSIKKALTDFLQLRKHCKFMTINLSMDELIGLSVVDTILNTIKELCFDPSSIIVELTETSTLLYPEETIQKLKQLVNVGVRVAIDDYGTGYSSLSYLKHLPVSIVKIDKLFIADIVASKANRIIVESTIRLAHRLKLKVVAEGIETPEQLLVLKKLHCDYAQGFYLARPMRCEKIEDLFR